MNDSFFVDSLVWLILREDFGEDTCTLLCLREAIAEVCNYKCRRAKTAYGVSGEVDDNSWANVGYRNENCRRLQHESL